MPLEEKDRFSTNYMPTQMLELNYILPIGCQTTLIFYTSVSYINQVEWQEKDRFSTNYMSTQMLELQYISPIGCRLHLDRYSHTIRHTLGRRSGGKPCFAPIGWYPSPTHTCESPAGCELGHVSLVVCEELVEKFLSTGDLANRSNFEIMMQYIG